MSRESNWKTVSTQAGYGWEAPLGIPPGGVKREQIELILEEVFLKPLAAEAWRTFGSHWQTDKRAFTELDRMSPDGLMAMARFWGRHFIKELPAAGITDQILWDRYILFSLRTDHEDVDGNGVFHAYLKHRIGRPGWPRFLERWVEVLAGSERPKFRDRFFFCAAWDLYPKRSKIPRDLVRRSCANGTSRRY